MSSLPRASAKAARNRMARVVTLMPPAVDAEPPPTNMSMSVTSRLEPSSCAHVEGREAAGSRHRRDEEALQDALADIHVGHRRRVVELEDEVGDRAASTSRPTKVTSVSLTCSDQRRGRAQVAAQHVDHREADRAEADREHHDDEEPDVAARTGRGPRWSGSEAGVRERHRRVVDRLPGRRPRVDALEQHPREQQRAR